MLPWPDVLISNMRSPSHSGTSARPGSAASRDTWSGSNNYVQALTGSLTATGQVMGTLSKELRKKGFVSIPLPLSATSTLKTLRPQEKASALQQWQ